MLEDYPQEPTPAEDVPATPDPPELADPHTAVRHQLAIAWTICAVIGALAISVIAATGATRLIIPILLMFSYLWYGTRFQGRNTPRFADSIYFLGFLWTLWALIDALVVHQSAAAKTIFGVFGYALVTTAFGMFCRLVLLQFQQTLPDQLLNAREAIEKDLLAFSNGLRRGTENLHAFQAGTQLALTDWTVQLGRTTEELQRAIRDAYLSGAQTHAHELGQMIEHLTTRMRTIDTALGELREEVNGFVRQFRASSTRFETAGEKFDSTLSGTATTIQTAIGGVALRIQAIDIPSNLISNKLDDLTTSLRSDAAAFRAALQATTATIEHDLTEVLAALKHAPQRADVTKILDEYLAALRTLLVSSEKLLAQTDAVAMKIHEFSTQAAAAGDSIQDLPERADKVSKELKRLEETTTTEVDKMLKETRTSREQLSRTASEVLTFIKHRLEERT